MKFNVNDCVKVKLTEKGISILKSQYTDLQRDCPSITEPFHFEVDENGYTEFQMWELMQTFGSSITMGCSIPFETNIIIPDGALKAE